MDKNQEKFSKIEKDTINSDSTTFSTIGENQELVYTIKRLEHTIQNLEREQKTIKRRLTWMAVGSYLRLFLFLIPLILGVIFLPKILTGVIDEYSDLLGMSDGEKSIERTTNAEQLNSLESALSTVVEKSVQRGVVKTISGEDIQQIIRSATPAQLQLFFSKYPNLRDEVEQIKDGTFEGNIQDVLLQIDPEDIKMFFSQ